MQNGLNALHLASKEGHVEVVAELIKLGATVDAATKVTPTSPDLILWHTSKNVRTSIEYWANELKMTSVLLSCAWIHRHDFAASASLQSHCCLMFRLTLSLYQGLNLLIHVKDLQEEDFCRGFRNSPILKVDSSKWYLCRDRNSEEAFLKTAGLGKNIVSLFTLSQPALSCSSDSRKETPLYT